VQITIPDAIKQMLQVVKQLQQVYPTKKFTLDGRLVGDLGEVIAEIAYEIKLHDDLRKHHDAIVTDGSGRQVQIKATMKASLTFPCDHIPDYYLGLKVHPDGTFTEIFNGPGSIAWRAIKNRQPTKTNLHNIAINALMRLNETVPSCDRIPRRVDGTNLK